MSQLELQIMQ